MLWEHFDASAAARPAPTWGNAYVALSARTAPPPRATVGGRLMPGGGHAVQVLTVPDGAAHGVRLWRLDLDLDTALPRGGAACLSADEVWRCNRYTEAADAARFALTRQALRRLLGEHLHLAPHKLNFRAGVFGKPLLAQAPALAFNVAHAGRHSLIAIADFGQIGIDIEQDATVLRQHAMLDTAFTDAERAWVAGGAGAALQTWVGKEAVLKAFGLGVGSHLQAWSVFPGLAAEYRVTPEQAGLPQAPALWRLPAPPGYAAALAWSTKG